MRVTDDGAGDGRLRDAKVRLDRDMVVGAEADLGHVPRW
jgi:hypothetical protein